MNIEDTKQELLQSISIIESEILLEKLQQFLKSNYETDRLTAVQSIELEQSLDEINEGKSSLHNKTGLVVSPTSEQQLLNYSEQIEEKLNEKILLLKQSPKAGRLYDSITEIRVLPLIKEISLYYTISDDQINVLAIFESKRRPNRVPRKMQ